MEAEACIGSSSVGLCDDRHCTVCRCPMS